MVDNRSYAYKDSKPYRYITQAKTLAFFSCLVYNRGIVRNEFWLVTHKECATMKQQLKAFVQALRKAAGGSSSSSSVYLGSSKRSDDKSRTMPELVSSRSRPRSFDKSCTPTFSQNPPRRSRAHALSPGMKENEIPGSRL